MTGIVRRDTNLDSISNDYLDLVLFHATGKNTGDLDSLVSLDLHVPAAQHALDLTFQLY